MDVARRADAAPSPGADNRLREVEALLAIATTVNATLDLPEALRRICRELSNLLGADTTAAYLHDTALDCLVTPDAAATEAGMKTIYQDGLAKALLGETALGEVFRVAL